MKEIIQELERIRKRTGGVLNPPMVVEAARDPDNPLHNHFTWDDSIAGHQYRLWQARQLIRVSVTLLPNMDSNTRMFVSLKQDRTAEGGYRHIVEVLNDVQLNDALLREAHADMKLFRKKYRMLKELKEVFASMDKFADIYGVTENNQPTSAESE